MRNAMKRYISLFMVLVMCLSFLPASAMADGTENAAEEVPSDTVSTDVETAEYSAAEEQSQTEENAQITEEDSAADMPQVDNTEETEQLIQQDAPSGGEAVEVEFVCSAEGTEISVWDDSGYCSPTEDGGRVYLLYPGLYDYSAYCDGYVSIDSYRFEVTDAPEHQTVYVEQTSSDDAFKVVFADPCIENQDFKEDFDRVGEYSSDLLLSASFAAPEYSDVASAGDALKSYLLNSDNGYLIKKIYGQKSSNKGKISSSEDNGAIELRYKSTDEPTEESINKLFDDIANYAIAHTGNTHEGDYLFRARMVGLSGEWTGSKYDGTYYSWTIKFVPYMTSTVAQESMADEYYSNVLNSLNLTSDLTAAQKVRRIYDWICANIDYNWDYTNYETYDANVHSAYRGIVEKNCVCQGFATVLYRLCLECGIDARSVGIYSGHEWNIVEIDGNYYFLDSTWDEDYDSGIRYYFLRGKTWWLSNHTSNNKVYYPGNLSQYCDENSAVPCTDIYTVSSSDYTWPEEFQTFDITLDYNDGTGKTESKSVTYNETHGELPTPVRTGYDFIGWYTSPTGVKRITQYSTVTAHDSYSLYAQWAPKKYTVTFDKAGGTGTTESIQVTYGSEYGELPVLERAGYEFSGWYTSADGGDLVTPDTVVRTAEDHVLYAHWKQTVLTVSFKKCGGTGTAGSKQVTFGSEYGELPVLTRTGYSFGGWHTSETEENEITAETIVTATENHVLYAHWIPNKYTVSLNCNGGTAAADSVQVTYGSKYGELPVPERPGYSFRGWFSAATGGTKVTSETDVKKAEDHMLYARWKANTYTVSFDKAGGTGTTDSIQVTFGKGYGELPVPERIGYYFSGWHTELTGGDEITETAAVTTPEDHVLFAHWTPISVYTVEYLPNGGEGEMEQQEFVYLVAQNLNPNQFTRTGYTFTGWKSGTKTFTDGQLVKNLSAKNGAKLTFTARWKADTFRIAFDANGGTGSIKPVSATYDKTSAKLPSSGLKKTGWVLKGWSLTPHDDEIVYSCDYKSGAALTAAQVNELYSSRDTDNTVTLYAVWGPAEYKITYKNLPTYAKGSVEVPDNSMNPAQFSTQTLPELTEPTVPGYTFESWFTDSKLTKPVTDAFWTGAAKTVYAKVTPVTYTISYNLNEGTAPAKGNKTSYNIKTSVTLNNPTRYGYTFAGWYLGETKVTKLSAGTYYGGDIELAARWTPNSYTLVLNGNGGKVPGQTKFTGLNTESELELPSLEDRDVYRFEGWSTKNDGTGDLYNPGQTNVAAAKNKSTVTLYAVWSYELAFNANGGDGTMESQKMFLNRSAAIDRGSYTKTGYYIAGWNTDQVKAGKGTVQYKDGASVKNLAGKTLYAVWKPVTYKVVFHNNIDGMADKTKTQTLTYDKQTALTANSFTWKGHMFQGWRTEDSSKNYTNKEKVTNLASKQGAEVHLYAIWN